MIVMFFCKCNGFEFVKGCRIYGGRKVREVFHGYEKYFKCDSYVSDYVFMHCRDIVDLMRRGVWKG